MIPEDHGANQTEYVSEYTINGDQVFCKDVRPLSAIFPYPWQLIHRVDFHNSLKEIATSSEGKGTPAVLNLRSRVESVDVEAPSLTLTDGTTHTGDLLIAADGVHSKIRDFVAPGTPAPASSGSSAFRFMIPVDEVRSDPRTAHFVEKTGEMRMHNTTDRRIVIYPCRKNTLLNFVAMHPEEETEASTEEWNQAASKETLLSCFKSYPEDMQALLSKASPESIKLWKLLDHDELGRENWVRGKTCLMGDAAHAFLPHQGQGGAQAVEDGAALGALFPLGTQVSDIPSRLQLYIQARYDRATMIQEFTRQSAFKTARGKHGGNPIDPMKFGNINMNHDAYAHASGILRRHLAQNALFTRMPTAFGPTLSPRQDKFGKPRAFGHPSHTTSYVKFKTYKSYLSALLPSEDLSIAGQIGWATATFTVTRLRNLDWLGGRGYSFFALHIHDVTDSKPATNGEATNGAHKDVKGDFVPVMFENLADPIITGREELGVAKVYATLDESTSDSSFALSAGWQGTEFCKLTLEGLTPASSETATAEEPPTLHWKVNPKTNSGELVSVDLPALNTEAQKVWKASSAKIEWTDLEGKELEKAFPTLVNIVEGLRAIKVVEVLESGMKASS
jgi:2-polyprenyl-6-methoxyphenol hydroxylase-like FAD-dependent oxidoreductase